MLKSSTASPPATDGLFGLSLFSFHCALRPQKPYGLLGTGKGAGVGGRVVGGGGGGSGTCE